MDGFQFVQEPSFRPCRKPGRTGKRTSMRDLSNVSPSSVSPQQEAAIVRSGFTPKQRAALSKILQDTLFMRPETNSCHREESYVFVRLESNTAIPIHLSLRASLQDVRRFRESLPKGSTFQVIWDSGATISISHDRNDFVGEFETTGIMGRLQGLAAGLAIKGKGRVAWSFHDVNGMLRTILVPGLYVPNCPARILATTSLCQTYSDETITADGTRMTLSGSDSDERRNAVVALVDPRNNLPTTTGYNYGVTSAAPAALNATISEVSDDNLNLTEAEKELLRWHCRLGHTSFRKVAFMMLSGALADSETARRLHTAAANSTRVPKCAACLFGKQTQRPSKAMSHRIVRDREGVLRKDDLLPGQKVSADHFVCSTKGRLFQSRGKTKDSSMYTGGCLFIDHATDLVCACGTANSTEHS